MIPSIVNLFKDRKAYKNAIKNDTDDSKIVTRELTPEELIQAKKDKEVLQRTDRKSTRLNSSHNNQSRMPSSA